MPNPYGELTPEVLDHLKELFNAKENSIRYLSIDPGKSNGICGYDAKHYHQFMMTVPSEKMTSFLDIFDNVITCICEDYTLYPNKAKDQIYSNMETSRVIGRIESWAERKDIVLVKQSASVKKTGYAWIGQAPPKKSNPLNHELDANAHFMYWAVRTGKINAVDLLGHANQHTGPR